ncbi:hypothetical protein U5922_000100 (plasmid) [Aquicoccus sp. G2-2]|uniref:hypothetical protein n=1 Tax=Aquicoccus sp. G2-2 TaxID=3092120 RepID=UPI00366EC0C7
MPKYKLVPKLRACPVEDETSLPRLRPLQSSLKTFKVGCVVVLCLLTSTSSPVWADAQECKPESISTEAAMLLSAKAVKAGIQFQDRIEELRADGISLETDSSFEKQTLDPAKHQKVALELWSRTRFGSKAIEEFKSNGLQPSQFHISIALSNATKRTVNYFTIAFYEHLSQLIKNSGEMNEQPAKSPFDVDPDVFTFMLRQFVDGAGLVLEKSLVETRSNYSQVTYVFHERSGMRGKDSTSRLQLRISADSDFQDVAIEGLVFAPRDWLKGGGQANFDGVNECFNMVRAMEEK